MASDLINIRDEVYLRIGVKKASAGFVFANNFILEKTWKPWEALEDLADPDKFPAGKLYILGGRLGDLINRGRQDAPIAGPREYGVQVGFQIVPLNINDDNEIDAYISFLEEVERVCQRETNLPPFSFSRIEYATDPQGQPLDFIMQRKALIFEAYFSAYFQKVVT